MIIEDLKKIKVDISEDDDRLSCTIEIPPRGRHFKRKVCIGTNDVVKFLRRKGFVFISNNALEKTIRNFKPEATAVGVWVFNKDNPKKSQIVETKPIENKAPPSPPVRKRRKYTKTKK